jgi:hypothetical protein
MHALQIHNTKLWRGSLCLVAGVAGAAVGRMPRGRWPRRQASSMLRERAKAAPSAFASTSGLFHVERERGRLPRRVMCATPLAGKIVGERSAESAENSPSPELHLLALGRAPALFAMPEPSGHR